MWDKVFKNGPSKICGMQPLKNKGYGLLYVKLWNNFLPMFFFNTPFIQKTRFPKIIVLSEGLLMFSRGTKRKQWPKI